MVKPSQEELERRRIIGINAETVTNIASTDFPGHYPGEDNSWDLDAFRKNFRVQYHSHAPLDATFSLIGLDASIANAFRRILLAEVSSLAIEHVYIANNTSIIQDEVLAHRLGLVPLAGDAKFLRELEWFRRDGDEEDPAAAAERPHTDRNTVILTLEAECTWKEKGRERAAKGDTDPDQLYEGHNVYAHQLTFTPAGSQPPTAAIRPTNPNILLAKLRPGQRLSLHCHAIKGIGADHAKFSPVATASYRLLPDIRILAPILGPDAHKFARCFPKGVIRLDRVAAADADPANAGRGFHPAYAGRDGDTKAVVADPLRDTVSRECLRHDEFRDKVRLGRVRDHFVFRVESVGQVDSDELFLESVRVLRAKCARVRRDLEGLMR